MKLEAVIFDLDQTLVDSRKIHVDSYIIPLNKGEIYPKPEAITSNFGTFEHVIFKKFSPKSSEEEIRQMILERKNVLLKEVSQTKKMSYSDEIFQSLKGKVKIALATGTFGEITYKTLEMFDWKKYFDVIVVGEEIKKSRPDPEILNITLNKLKMDATKAIYVGDSVYDAQCAKNAKLKIIVLGDFKEADFNAKNLLDVKNILENLIDKNQP
jgi:HAD superfamily hydrolase (TIGR01549 family)